MLKESRDAPVVVLTGDDDQVTALRAVAALRKSEARLNAILENALDAIVGMLFTLKRQTGSGLGLAVSQQIAVAHGGQILFESESGAGSTFYVTLPLITIEG